MNLKCDSCGTVLRKTGFEKEDGTTYIMYICKNRGCKHYGKVVREVKKK